MQDYSYCTPSAHLGVASSASVSVEKRASLRCEDLDKKFVSEFNEERKVNLLSSPSRNHGKELKSRHLSPSTSRRCAARKQVADSTSSPDYRSLASDVLSSSVDEEMDMRYADNTHHQLRNSLAKINSKNFVSESQRKSPRSSPLSYDKRLVDRSISNEISRFDSVIRSKDYLLQEKDSVIVNLRLEKASLEHRIKEISAGLYQNTEGSAGFDSARSERKQRHLHEANQSSKQNLRLLLGKTESELRETRMQMEKERKIYDERLKKITERCNMKEMQLEENNKRHRVFADQLTKYKKRTECLERYLGELPTREENDELKAQASQLATERESLSLEIELLKDKLEKKIRKANDKEFCLQKSLEVQTKQQEKIEELTNQVTEMERLKLPLEATEREQFKEMKLEVERLQKEQLDMRKVMMSANNSAKQQSERHRSEVNKLETRMYEAREETENSREEMKLKQQTLDKVNKEMISLTSQNQCFMEENMTLQDKVKTLKKKLNYRGEDHRLQGRLQNEISSTIHELKCVTQLLMQTMEGSEVNVSNLFGAVGDYQESEADGLATPDSGTGGDVSENERSISTLERRLREVRNSRNDIEKLRTLISNKYADNIGDNCVTQ